MSLLGAFRIAVNVSADGKATVTCVARSCGGTSCLLVEGGTGFWGWLIPSRPTQAAGSAQLLITYLQPCKVIAAFGPSYTAGDCLPEFATHVSPVGPAFAKPAAIPNMLTI